MAMSADLRCNDDDAAYEEDKFASRSWRLVPPIRTTFCDAARQPSQSTSFQVMAALDQKDEVQRIRMAQILHDLHHLAKTYPAGGNDTSVKIQRQGTMRRVWKFVRRPFSRGKNNEEVETIRNVGTLAAGCNFDAMTPKKAHEIIEELTEQNGHFDTPTLLRLLQSATKLLKQDETLVDMRGVAETVSIVGDLHGSLSSLNFILEAIGDVGGKTKKAVIFDGDFVDRGNESLEVLCILLLLKLAHPQHVVLLRGNHEDILVASAYGFHDELLQKYGSEHAEQLWDEFNAIFCALPIVALTENAAIVHGGLPSKDFVLDDVRKITTEQRCKVQSIVEPKTEHDKLVQGLLWSDPMTADGIKPNTTRTIGVFFGPDVVFDFLKRHNLMYLIRGHEVAEKGVNQMECGEGRSVMTLFSHSEYPNGTGSNLGAFCQLHKDGHYDMIKFSRMNKRFTKKVDRDDPYVETLKTLIANNKHKLEKAFKEVAPTGEISAHEWIEVMANTLNMPEVPWPDLLPSLVPDLHGNDAVDWDVFLFRYSSVTDDQKSCQESNIRMEILYANHQMLMAVFNFLDVNRNGTIDATEFITGIDLLNKRLPHDRQLKDPAALFKQIDKDGTGRVCLEEFAEVFKVMQ
mmetsp:Transcript_9681/g.16108  ORF Transcript_9681/g.16108 Transcript_9681/m.16108 type:complete len:630 (-) Transcript_9681:27-1916(-)